MAWMTIFMAVGQGVQAYAQVEQGRAARAAGKAQAEIAARNAALAERKAEAEQLAAAAEAKIQREEGEELLAKQRGLFAKGGVEMRGTPLAVIVDTAEELEADRLTILREGAITAAQQRGRADVFRMRGRAARRKGEAAYRGSVLSAGGTLLSGFGRMGPAR